MNTQNTREEDLIDLGTFSVETKGEIDGPRPDHPVLPTKFPTAGLTSD